MVLLCVSDINAVGWTDGTKEREERVRARVIEENSFVGGWRWVENK